MMFIIYETKLILYVLSFSLSYSIILLHSPNQNMKKDSNLQSTPDNRYLNGPIIRIRIQHGRGIRIESHFPALGPQNGAIQIRRRNSKERKIGHCEREFEDNERPQKAVEPPFTRDEEARHCEGRCDAISKARYDDEGS